VSKKAAREAGLSLSEWQAAQAAKQGADEGALKAR